MREIIRKIITVIAAILALAAIIFIFVALCKHLGWAIPTVAFGVILAFLAWQIWRVAGVQRLINFVASLIALAIIGFIGWAVWNHFFDDTTTVSDGKASSEQIDNQESQKEKQNSNSKKEESLNEKSKENSRETQTTSNDNNPESLNSSQEQPPATLPQTGFELQD